MHKKISKTVLYIFPKFYTFCFNLQRSKVNIVKLWINGFLYSIERWTKSTVIKDTKDWWKEKWPGEFWSSFFEKWQKLHQGPQSQLGIKTVVCNAAYIHIKQRRTLEHNIPVLTAHNKKSHKTGKAATHKKSLNFDLKQALNRFLLLRVYLTNDVLNYTDSSWRKMQGIRTMHSYANRCAIGLEKRPQRKVEMTGVFLWPIYEVIVDGNPFWRQN